MNSLVSADSVLAVTGILFAVVGICIHLEARFAWAGTLSAALLALLGGLVLSNTGVLPFASPAYDFINEYFILMAIPLLLFKSDLRVVLAQGGRTLAAFGFAAVGIVTGAVLAHWLIEVPESAKYAGMLVGGYTGGGLNFVAVSQAVGMEDPSLATAALAAESLAGIAYLFVLALLPTVAAIRRWLPLRGPELERPGGAGPVPGDSPAQGVTPAPSVAQAHLEAAPAQAEAGPNADAAASSRGGWSLHAAAAIALSLLICAAGVWLATAMGRPNYAILATTALTVLIANLFPRALAKLKGDQELGMLLLYVFFVVYAAGADVRSLLGAAALLLTYAGIVIVVQVVFSAVGAKIFRFSYAEILTASNACVLGPPTAAALAAGRGWHGLVTPGVLTGVFGYVVGNFLGVSVWAWLS